jgi:GTP cyclohydrolase I
MDLERIEKAVGEIIAAVGEDSDREGLVGTPERIARMYAELFSGIGQDPLQELGVGFEGDDKEMVVLKNIPFYSMCEHHLLPFHGIAHVGYLPNGRYVGISKLARVVEVLARRPQLQERLTSQIADTIMAGIEPLGVAVLIEAEHLCMTMRGIRKPGSRMVTSATRGHFRARDVTRNEFFSILRQPGSNP